MSTLNVPHTFNADEIVESEKFNENNAAVANVLNGELDNDNFDTSPLIDPEKLDDLSANLDAMMIMVDPYPSGSESLSTDLRGEIRRLRYQVSQITGEPDWFSDAPRSLMGRDDARSLLINGSFEAQSGGADTAPDGWTITGAPSQILLEVATVANGSGSAVRIVAANPGDGIIQALSGLKASTSYVFSISARPNSASSSGMVRTTGASTNLALSWDGASDGTSYLRKSATFVTDALGSDVVVRLEVDAATDDVSFDNALAQSSEPSQGDLVAQQAAFFPNQITLDGFEQFIERDASGNIYYLEMSKPNSGMYIVVDFYVSFLFLQAASSRDYSITLRLRETTAGEPPTAGFGVLVDTVKFDLVVPGSSGDKKKQIHLSCVRTLDADETYGYWPTVSGLESGGAGSVSQDGQRFNVQMISVG